MANRTLAGLRVAVTRPEAQCASLVEAIRERGGEALAFPLIVIEALPDSPQLHALCERLEQFDLAFFVSPNAVRHGLAAIRGLREWPPGVAVATVGEGSRRALQAQGFERVIAPQGAADSEAVLALPEFSAAALRGRRLLILRGEGGRELLAEQARERGAEVTQFACYRRLPPSGGGDALLSAAQAGRLDALTLTSSESVANLQKLLGPDGLASLAALPLFASHPRIAQRAVEAGFRQVHTTAAGDAGLLAALDAHFGSLG